MLAQPVITDLVNDGTGTSFTVTFTADPAAIVYAAYKRLGEIVYPAEIFPGFIVGSGSIQVTGLNPESIYLVQILSRDGMDNYSLPSDIAEVFVSAESLPPVTRILNNLITTLEQIKIVNGFLIDVQRVERFKHLGNDLDVYPTIFVAIEDADFEQIPHNKISKELNLVVDCWSEVEEDHQEELSLIQAEVEKALVQDRTRGGLCWNTVLSGFGFYLTDAQKVALVRQRVTCQFRTKIDNPYKTGI